MSAPFEDIAIEMAGVVTGSLDVSDPEERVTCCCTYTQKQQIFGNISQGLNDMGSYVYEGVTSFCCACLQGWKVGGYIYDITFLFIELSCT